MHIPITHERSSFRENIFRILSLKLSLLCVCVCDVVLSFKHRIILPFIPRATEHLYINSIPSRYTYLPTFTHTHLVFKSFSLHCTYTFHPPGDTILHVSHIFVFKRSTFTLHVFLEKHFFAICYFVYAAVCTALRLHCDYGSSLDIAYEEFRNQRVEA